MSRIEAMPLGQLKGNPKNPKTHALEAITASIERFGFADAVIIDDRTGQLVSGHGRVEALREMQRRGPDKPPIGVTLEAGDWLVPVQRGWRSKDDREAEAFIVAANRLVEAGGWDDASLAAILGDLAKAGAIDGVGYSKGEIDALLEELTAEPVYTRKIEAPVYTPKGEQPKVRELFDDSKTRALVEEIDAAGLPEELARFLRIAAERHTVIKFRRVAEFYAAAPPDVQRLFERQALVIIDFNAAVERGFVRLTEQLGAIAEVEGWNDAAAE